jgi:serine/threonine protein kinase
LQLRSSGQEPERQQLESDNEALMPELGRELDKLDMIHRVVGTVNDGLANTQRHEPENVSTRVPAASHRAASRPGPEAPDIPDYDLVSAIGRGGFGTVWLGRNRVDQAYVAIKTFPSDCEVELDGVRVYKQFAKNSRHLIPIEHVGTAGEYFYYVMPLADDARDAALLVPEHYEPKTLQWFLANRLTLPAEQLVDIGRQVAESLVELHRNGITHCDVKPANVMQLRGVWMLGDLGLIDRTDRLTADRGTRAFWPPEGPQDPSADVYALGKTMYLLLVGIGAGEFSDFVQGRVVVGGAPEVASAVVRIIARACADRPADRYRSSQHVLNDLQALTAPKSVKERKRISWIGVTAALVAVVLLGFSLEWMLSPENRDSEQESRADHASSDRSGAVDPRAGRSQPARPFEQSLRMELSVTAIEGNERQAAGRFYSRLSEDGDLPLDRELADFSVRPGDEIEVFMESKVATYCYLLVFNSDGSVDQVWPHDGQARSTTEIGPDGAAQVLNFRWQHRVPSPVVGGEVLQLYVLISANRAFREEDPEWPRFVKELDWLPTYNKSVWYFHAEQGQHWPRDIEISIPRRLEQTLRSLPDLLGGQRAIGIALPVAIESASER